MTVVAVWVVVVVTVIGGIVVGGGTADTETASTNTWGVFISVCVSDSVSVRARARECASVCIQ